MNRGRWETARTIIVFIFYKSSVQVCRCAGQYLFITKVVRDEGVSLRGHKGMKSFKYVVVHPGGGLECLPCAGERRQLDQTGPLSVERPLV